jgi:DNA processing protein
MRPFLYSALTRLTSIPTSLRSRLLGEEELLQSVRDGFHPPSLEPKLSKALASLDWKRAEEEDRRIIEKGVRLVPWGDPAYPDLLAQIPDPPPALYVRGRLAALCETGVALVGSRLSTVYGQSVARTLGEDLAREGLCVTSGLARGIDTAVHEGALSAGGVTLAVLGTGIDVPYPPENHPLLERIARAEGAVVTEYPPGTPPMPRNFPARNRVIAGLSWAVVVVEATERSGALITARFAAETGRDVFAVPHPVTSRTGIGPNTLIQKGAKLILRSQDVLEELPAHLRCKLKPISASSQAVPQGEEESAKSVLFKALRLEEGLGIDALCSATGLPAHEVLAQLVQLQMAGLCVELPGMRYARRRA